MRYIYLALVVAFAVLLVIFALSNMASATLSFLGWQITGPLALMILALYLLGMVSGGSVFSVLRHSLHKATQKPEPKMPKPAAAADLPPTRT